MEPEILTAFVDEMEKIALSVSTVVSAAKKRGVPVGYLKQHAQVLAENANLHHAYKSPPSKIPEAVKQRHNASAWDDEKGELANGVGRKYLASWLKNKRHRLNPETKAVLSKDRARRKEIHNRKTSKE